jgi:hypothetical protein
MNTSVLSGPVGSTRPGTMSEVKAVHLVSTSSLRCSVMLDLLPAALMRHGRTVPLHVHATPAEVPWEPAEDALLVVVVDSPANALSAAAAMGSREKMASALSQWGEVAKLALRSAHRHPKYCTLVDAAVPPCDLTELFASIDLAAPGGLVIDAQSAHASDAVEDALVERAVMLDPTLATLHEELRVSCRWPPTATPTTASVADALGALEEYHESRAQRDTVKTQAGQIANLGEERELLIRQVRQLEQTASSLHAKVASLQSEGRVPVRERDKALNEARHLRNEGLLRERAYRPGAASPELHLRAEGLQLMSRNDSGEHRHLDFMLQKLFVGDRTLTHLHFRLLDHLDRPGLAIFGPVNGPQLLGQWEAHGQEGERPFMLLVPSEERGETLLQRMGTADWRLVCTLAQVAAIELSHGHDQLPSGWRTVASRLGRQLSALEPRLRYNKVLLRAVADGSSKAIDVELVDPLFGAHPLGALRLRWHPVRDGRQVRLEALAGADGAEVALASWPSGPGGLLQPLYLLPVGSAWSRSAWLSMPAWDRGLLLALLDALPGIAQQTADGVLPGGWTRDALADAARQLSRNTRNAVRVLNVRRSVTRLLRRFNPAG